MQARPPELRPVGIAGRGGGDGGGRDTGAGGRRRRNKQRKLKPLASGDGNGGQVGAEGPRPPPLAMGASPSALSLSQKLQQSGQLRPGHPQLPHLSPHLMPGGPQRPVRDTDSQISTSSSHLSTSAILAAYREKQRRSKELTPLAERARQGNTSMPSPGLPSPLGANQDQRRRPRGGAGGVPARANHQQLTPIASVKQYRAHVSPLNVSGPMADNWRSKTPTVPGEACSPAQRRLSGVDNFTGMYKSRFVPELATAASGDYCDEPRKATKHLLNRRHDQLTIPKRAADFRDEVEWRMNLRPNL